MNRLNSDSTEIDSPPDSGAYLVLRSAGRWSDVFRLSAPNQAVIGRASSNQIVIRTDQASRCHARVQWSGDGWVIEDLESRNGTFVNGQRLSEPVRLSDSDVIEIGGFAITFTGRIEGGLGRDEGVAEPAQATDDQITIEVDPGDITDRRRHSAYLHSTRGVPVGPPGKGASRDLLRLAFELARCDEMSSAVDVTLDSLGNLIAFDTAGAYVWQASKPPASISEIPLSATRQSGSRSYRRPPESLMESVSGEDGEAVLARNILGDGGLATENSRGEMDVESVIVAPIRNSDDRLLGFLHLTTCSGGTPLDSSDLELVVAAGEILAESLARLDERRRLSRSLHRSRRKVVELQERLGDKVRIVGDSEPMSQVIGQIELAAPTNTTILIRGESGVGKELVASALHHASARKDGPLVCLNCAALSPTLLESELFGHEKGAFTGATERKKGKFELATGGTLMLDEIGEMSAEVQAKFLRVLEGHPFERVGGHEPIRADVRVVAATNRDLQAMVREGTFRQDLYYRLHVLEIFVPPLRNRGKDCLQLANFFLKQFNQEIGRKIDGFTEAAKKQLIAYSWPGNIRELKNVIERAVVLTTKPNIDVGDLVMTPALRSGEANVANEGAVEMTLAQLERSHIERVLRHTEGNKSRAALILGIERSTLDRKLKRYVE